MGLNSTNLGEGVDTRWEMRELEGMRKLRSMQRVVLIGVVVRQITTYVPHICRTVSGGVSSSEVCMSHAYCVHGRSCQGLIECLYMTSSCWGLGCALGKVENNERRTAAKHNRIHLYLPTAAWPCVWTAPACRTRTHGQLLNIFEKWIKVNHCIPVAVCNFTNLKRFNLIAQGLVTENVHLFSFGSEAICKTTWLMSPEL